MQSIPDDVEIDLLRNIVVDSAHDDDGDRDNL
jgi:hypothetical protein